MTGDIHSRPIRFLSLFSGIEAASMAWKPLGWECVGVAEVEPFPCSLLAHHYPNIPNLGDVAKITEERIKQLGHIDLVVGGFPCQDLSVAGKRKGLINADGTATRSGLFFTGLQIFFWAKQHCNSRFLLIENVPGLFSSNKGADFAAVVGHMAGLENVSVPGNGWGAEGVAVGNHGMLEWCTLDAQWFGLAQRRKRVFALLDTGDWAGRPPILLEPESLRGDSAPSRETGESLTHDVAPSLTGSGRGIERTGESRGQDPVVGCWWDGGQVSQTLDAVLYKGQTMPEKNRFPAVLQSVAHTLRADGFDASEDGCGRGTPLVPDIAPCLTSNYGKQPDSSDTSKGPLLVPVPILEAGARTGVSASDPRAGIGIGEPGDPMYTLQAGKQHAVAFSCKDYGADVGETSPTLRAMGHAESHANAGGQVAVTYRIHGEHSTAMTGNGNARVADPVDVVRCLDSCGGYSTNQGGNVVMQHAVAFAQNSRDEVRLIGGDAQTAGALTAEQGMKQQTYLAQPYTLAIRGCGDESHLEYRQDGTSNALLTPNGGRAGMGVGAIALPMAVRRITPLECERLQGFPDKYTLVPHRGKLAADGPRYKALGNSFAVPVVRWIGERIEIALEMAA